MSILNARLLGAEGVGVVVLLNLLKTLSVRVSDLGFGRAIRFFSANREIHYRNLRIIVFSFGPIVGISVLLITILLKYLPINVWNEIDRKVFYFFLPTPFFFVLTMYLRHLLHGQLIISQINISDLLERVLYIILFVFFVWYLDLGLLGVSYALSTSTFFLFLQLAIYSLKYRQLASQEYHYRSKKATLTKLWYYGRWSYYSSFIDFIFQQFPILFLKSSLDSLAQIGYFSKAQGLANYPKISAIPLSGLLFSYNASSSEKIASNRTEILCRFTFFIVTLLFIVMAISIKPIISFLYGNEFLPAARIYYFLYPSIIFYIQSTYLSSAIAARGFIKEIFLIQIKSLPIIILVVYLLISHFETVGAAIALGISSTILWIQYILKYLSINKSKLSNLLLLKKQDIKMIKNIIIKLKKRY